MPPRSLGRKGAFWARVGAADRTASVLGARFADDTSEKRIRRMAEAIALPEKFNTTYLGHYFRDEGSPVHALVYLALQWESRLAVRMPRGHGKSTAVTFAYVLRQVVCAPILRAWVDGTLAASHPELHAALTDVMAEEARARIAAGPLHLSDLGVPAHWDPEVDEAMNAWLGEVYQRQVALGETLPLKWDPYIQIIAVDAETSLEFTSAIRAELERNDLIRSDWGDLTPCMTGDWTRGVKRAASDEDFESNGTRVRAYGMAESIRGGKHGEWRPSLAVFDDPDSEESSRTIRQRDGNIKKLTKAVNFGLEPKTGRVIVCGTPHHPDCMVVRLTEFEQFKARWRMLRFRARDEDGVILYPARWSKEALDAEEAEDAEAVESELGDRPPAQGGRPVSRIHYYDRQAFAEVLLPKVLAFDPSLGRKATSDFQAVVVLRGPTADGWILVHRVELLRIADPEQLVAHLNAIHDAEKPDLAVIEAISFGSLLQMLLQSQGRRSGLFPGWVRIERQAEAKDLRITGMAPLVNDGTYRFPSDGSCRRLERQLLEYGDSGSKKDGPDAMEMGGRYIRRSSAKRADVRHSPRSRVDGVERRGKRQPFGRPPETRRSGW